MINNKCKLVLQDLYFYDFKSAYPRLMKSIGWDFSNVDLDNKYERNIYIGIQQRNNINLSSFLIDSITKQLEYYLLINDIKDENIIVTQRDGYILNKPLKINDGAMKLDFRGHIDLLILSPDRKKYMAITEKEVVVKGIKNYYKDLDNIYRKFLKLSFLNKKILFSQLENLKNEVINGTDKELYIVKIKDKKFIQSYNNIVLEISDDKYINISTIDRRRYFDHYFKEFFQSIFLEFD